MTGTFKNNIATRETAELAQNKIIGIGSLIYEIRGEMALKPRANELQKPIAVAAKRFGNK